MVRIPVICREIQSSPLSDTDWRYWRD